MSQPYLLSIDYLRSGATQKFSLSLDPDFFEIQEDELCFPNSVFVEGEAYLVEQDLILRFNAKTEVRMPCGVCNKMTPMPLAIQGVYHTVPLEECSRSLFDLRPVVREELLVELPKRAECAGSCPDREQIAPYLKAESKNYFPFSDLK